MSTYNEILEQLVRAATDILVARGYYKSGKQLDKALERLRAANGAILTIGEQIQKEAKSLPVDRPSNRWPDNEPAPEQHPF